MVMMMMMMRRMMRNGRVVSQKAAHTRVSDGASPATVAMLCCVSGGYRSRKSGMAAVPVSGRVSLLRSHGSG